MTTIVDKMDVRPGGSWRFIAREADGKESGFRGQYREIVPGEKIVQTFEWEPMAGHISTETATFTDLPDGRTLLTTRSVFSSKEDRDGMVQSGMETGLRETYDRFDELLASRLLLVKSPSPMGWSLVHPGYCPWRRWPHAQRSRSPCPPWGNR